MSFSRLEVIDQSGKRMRAFGPETQVHHSSEGEPWDDSILVEHLTLPPGEMCDCYSVGYTVLQHLRPSRIERLSDSHHLECLSVGPDTTQLDPARTLLGARWSSAQELLFVMPRETTILRACLELNGGQTPEFFRRSGVQDPLVAQIGLLLLDEMRSGSHSGRLFGESLAVALTARLVTCFAKTEIKLTSPDRGLQRWRLKRTLEYISDNIGEELGLATLAEVAGLSEYYFCRLFKLSVGMTPHKYVMSQRFDRAKGLLKSSKLSISSISGRLGFSDQTHFAVSFRRATKMTPTEFRFGG